MAATPRFTKNAKISAAIALSTATTKSDGSGTIATDMFLLYTGDATFGGYCDFVRFMPTSSVAATSTTTAATARVYLSSQTSGAVTAANTVLLGEVVLPVVTAAAAAAANNPIDLPINIPVPAGYTILASIHALPFANTAWRAAAICGDY